MEYLYNFGLDSTDLDIIRDNVSEDIYSDLTFFENLVVKNIQTLKEFGVTNYSQVIIKYPEIFLRDEESFNGVLAKFDKEDLIQKVAKNVAVFKKMVDYVDNN